MRTVFTTGMRERDEDGRITETTTPDAVLEYFEEVEAGVVSSGTWRVPST